LMGFIAALGFLTFGKNASGLVLNNYAPNDLWMSASRVAVAVSLVFSYPLAFQGCRDGVLDVLRVPEEKKKSNALLNTTTVVLLAVLTLMAATLKDVSFVMAFSGAILGNLLTYVYPAIMYRGVVKKLGLPGETVGIAIATLSAVLGTVMGAIGAKIALDQQK
jgi:amino acid permease